MSKKTFRRKTIFYTKHALDEMIEHKLSTNEIEAIRDTGRIVKQSKGRVEVHLGKKGNSLVALFEDYPKELVLITVWRE